MAIKNKQEILENLRKILGEKTDDESIGIIEDISDTIDDFEKKTADTTNWEEKYKQNDAEWRKKYTERFFTPPDKEEEENQEQKDNDKALTYDNLFEQKES